MGRIRFIIYYLCQYRTKYVYWKTEFLSYATYFFVSTSFIIFFIAFSATIFTFCFIPCLFIFRFLSVADKVVYLAPLIYAVRYQISVFLVLQGTTEAIVACFVNFLFHSPPFFSDRDFPKMFAIQHEQLLVTFSITVWTFTFQERFHCFSSSPSYCESRFSICSA